MPEPTQKPATYKLEVEYANGKRRTYYSEAKPSVSSGGAQIQLRPGVIKIIPLTNALEFTITEPSAQQADGNEEFQPPKRQAAPLGRAANVNRMKG